MGDVRSLCHEEGVRLDAARLAAMVVAMGENAAERTMCRAMEDMALILAEMERHYREGETAVICRCARRLSRLAGEVGMSTLARVASDVALCAGRGDMVAFAATRDRLQRIADRSLTAVWELQGASG